MRYEGWGWFLVKFPVAGFRLRLGRITPSVTGLEEDYMASLLLDGRLIVQPTENRVDVVEVGRVASGSGVLLADGFVQNARPVAIPWRQVVIDGSSQDSRVRFDSFAIDCLQNGDAFLLAGTVFTEGSNRIRNQARSRHKWNLFPIDATSLQENTEFWLVVVAFPIVFVEGCMLKDQSYWRRRGSISAAWWGLAESRLLRWRIAVAFPKIQKNTTRNLRAHERRGNI